MWGSSQEQALAVPVARRTLGVYRSHSLAPRSWLPNDRQNVPLNVPGLARTEVRLHRQTRCIRALVTPAVSLLCSCLHWRLGRRARKVLRVHLANPAQVLPLNQDDVEAFTSVGDMTGLHDALKAAYNASVRVQSDTGTPLPESFNARGAGLTRTTIHKLEHDIEQFEYLSQQIDVQVALRIQLEVLPAYYKMLHHAQQHGDNGGFFWFDFAPADAARSLRPFYNRGLHLPEAAPESQHLGNFDSASVERDYLQGTPRIAVVDDVLSPETFAAARALLLESTVWHEAKAAQRIGGYVGAYLTDGLYAQVLLDISAALSARLPGILKDHPLRFLWAYKYDHRYSGVNIHGDDAAVNVNIWLTPDSANLDTDSGGLVIYKTQPPNEWSAEEYNAAERTGFQDLLKPGGWESVTVPYRANRMVLFDSTLLHKTDNFNFKAGYENRRLNLTMLFGERPQS